LEKRPGFGIPASRDWKPYTDGPLTRNTINLS